VETTRVAALRNFRDASGPEHRGYAALDGRRMRRGRLYRSDNATELGADDAARLRELGLGRAFDLRSATERRRVPSIYAAIAPGPDVTVFEDLTSFNEGELRTKLLTTLVASRDVSGLMHLYYRQLPGVFAKPLETIFAALADGAPVVVHCRGGKDRTGFAVAIVHLALGVSRADAMADYLLSAGLFEPGAEEDAMIDSIRRRTFVRLEPATLAPMMTVAPAYLETALAAIDERGGIEAYLATACGLDAARRTRLIEQLTA